jgi:hypothetical protein
MGDPEKKVDAKAIIEADKAKAAERKQAYDDFVAKTGTINGAKVTGVLRSSGRVPIKRLEKPKEDGKLKTIDINVSDIEVTKLLKTEPVVASVPAVTSKGSIDLRGTPLEKTMNALRTFDIPFSYDLFHDQYLVGDRALQLRIGENIDHAILVLRTAIIKKFQFESRSLRSLGPLSIECA